MAGPALTFDAETKKASCPADMSLTTLQLNVTANRDWSSEILWDADETPWIAVTPEKGLASDQPQRVTLTILNNAGYNRNKTVKFTIGYDYKTIDITQTGERGEEIIGTLDNPLTVAGAVKYVKSLGADVQSSSGVYVKGKISRIDDGSNFASSGTYGNATFYISDDGTTNLRAVLRLPRPVPGQQEVDLQGSGCQGGRRRDHLRLRGQLQGQHARRPSRAPPSSMTTTARTAAPTKAAVAAMKARPPAPARRPTRTTWRRPGPR